MTLAPETGLEMIARVSKGYQGSRAGKGQGPLGLERVRRAAGLIKVGGPVGLVSRDI